MDDSKGFQRGWGIFGPYVAPLAFPAGGNGSHVKLIYRIGLGWTKEKGGTISGCFQESSAINSISFYTMRNLKDFQKLVKELFDIHIFKFRVENTKKNNKYK